MGHVKWPITRERTIPQTYPVATTDQLCWRWSLYPNMYAYLYTSLSTAALHTLTNARFVKMFACPCWKLLVSWLCLLLRLLSQFAVLGSGASVSMATCWVFWIADIPSSPHPSLCVAAVCLARFWRALLLDKFSYNSAFELVNNYSYLSLVSHTTNQIPISISYWASEWTDIIYI